MSIDLNSPTISPMADRVDRWIAVASRTIDDATRKMILDQALSESQALQEKLGLLIDELAEVCDG